MDAAQIHALEYLNFGRRIVDFSDSGAISFIAMRQLAITQYIDPAKRTLGENVFQPERFMVVRQNIIDTALHYGLTTDDGEAYLDMVHTISVNYQERQR